MADIRVKILLFQQDGTVVSQYLLGEGVHVIGRDPNSAIYAESEYISNEHAKLHLTDEGIFIEDLNSTAGTFLDDVTVRGKLRLNSGQRLQVGDLYIDLQLEAAGELAPGAKIGAGRYQLLKELGRGAMGQVWLGQDIQLDEHVAIKVLGSDVVNDAVSLLDLKREVQKSRKLSHDNIIRIHDLVQLPGETPFITLEYVEGTDLHAIQLNQPDRIFQWAEVKSYVLQLCEALGYAHERKIVHRDLKAPNIMIAKNGVLKLADFGIAASIADATGRSSLANIISGTPQFMSPEQMLGKSPKASDDIYALGATIYDLLTGRPPFHTGDIAQQVHHVTPAPIEQRLAEFGLQNSVPDYVNSVVLSCLAKDPEVRPSSAGAIAEWIRTEGKSDIPAKRKKTKTGVEKITPEEPIQAEAEPASPVEAQLQPAKGKKTPVLAIAAAVAAIVVILGVLSLSESGGKDENQNQGQDLQPDNSELVATDDPPIRSNIGTNALASTNALVTSNLSNGKTPAGRRFQWQVNGTVATKELAYYKGGSSSILTVAFGDPDRQQDDVWIYTGLCIRNMSDGSMMTTVRFAIRDNIVTGVIVPTDLTYTRLQLRPNWPPDKAKQAVQEVLALQGSITSIDSTQNIVYARVNESYARVSVQADRQSESPDISLITYLVCTKEGKPDTQRAANLMAMTVAQLGTYTREAKTGLEDKVGKIANVDPRNGSLILNRGSSHGFKVGDKFNVFRNNKLIGRIEVTRLSLTNPGLSIAQRSEGLGVPAAAQFQVNDDLVRFPAKPKDAAEAKAAAEDKVGKTPIGKKVRWQVNGTVATKELSLYNGKPSSTLTIVFGNPDQRKGNVWLYSGLTIHDIKTGEIKHTARFTVNNGTVTAVEVFP